MGLAPPHIGQEPKNVMALPTARTTVGGWIRSRSVSSNHQPSIIKIVVSSFKIEFQMQNL